MSRALIIFGLAVLLASASLPQWMLIAGGAAFGWGAVWKFHKQLEQ